ncbi:MAG: hypothetical protein ABI540_01560 [Spartobacteria bacterium]
MGRTAFVRALALACCLGSGRADVFTVTTVNVLGAGSLTEAIEAVNANPGADTIAFNIPGPGVHTISIGDTGLPDIIETVTIDGYTQPGASANTLDPGDNAVILIRIDGTPQQHAWDDFYSPVFYRGIARERERAPRDQVHHDQRGRSGLLRV